MLNSQQKILILEDDPLMAECLSRAVSPTESYIFTDAISATSALDDFLPDLIILDVLLTGPDGFSFLNELQSYPDTMNIPVIVVSSLDLSNIDMAAYNIVSIFNKDTMTPSALKKAVCHAL